MLPGRMCRLSRRVHGGWPRVPGIESKPGDGEVYLVFVHWTTIQKNLKKTNVPERMKVFDAFGAEHKGYILSRSFTPPRALFFYTR